MRVYAVTDDDAFVEYKPEPFAESYTEKTIETWLEGNPDAILEDGGLLIIGRQVTTDLGGAIDLLAVDRQGHVVVIELKRDRTPRETLAQALEYASFAVQLDYDQLETLYQTYTGNEGTSLVEAHRDSFGLGDDEAVSFNKDQRIVIVGSDITPAIRQTARYLRQQGLRVTCLEFSYFCTEAGRRLLSIDVAVGSESGAKRTVATARLPRTTSARFMRACDDSGRVIFEPLFRMATDEGLVVRWGQRGFSLNFDHEGDLINVCLGFPDRVQPNQTAQSLIIAFREMERKLGDVDALVDSYRPRFLATTLFHDYGSYRDVCFTIDHALGSDQVDSAVGLVRDLARDLASLAGDRAEKGT